jgi:hypothetical protein
MTQESYSLREIAELLGVSRRTLQRRLQEGAFPGRFLALGKDGLEIRVPGSDVQHLLGSEPGSESDWAVPSPRRPNDSLVPFAAGPAAPISQPPVYTSALTSNDLESLRDAMLAIVREERESFMVAVRDALEARDQEIAQLRAEVAQTRGSVDRMSRALESVERTVGAAWKASTTEPWSWAETIGGPAADDGAVDVDRLLRELGELEAFLSAAS